MSRELSPAQKQDRSRNMRRSAFRQLRDKWGGEDGVSEILGRFYQDRVIRLEEKQALSVFINSSDGAEVLALSMGVTRNGLYSRVYGGLGKIIKYLTARGESLGDFGSLVGKADVKKNEVSQPEPAKESSGIQAVVEKLGGSIKLQDRIRAEKEFAKEAGSKCL